MRSAMEFLFWLSLSTILFVYFGYPLLLWAIQKIRKRPVFKRVIQPSVSILIAAYNEEDCIAQTIENKLSLNYPRNRMEIIVVSDASTDRTNAIVQRYWANGVKLIVQPRRMGKTAALNRAFEECTGKIIVFSDANSIYHRDALLRLVQNFGDPKVGYVTGQMNYHDEKESVIGEGCQSYMGYENRLRTLETAVGSVVGVDGGIDAIRKDLFRPMRHDMLPDFILPLRVVEQGFRVVYEPRAHLIEPTLDHSKDELKMRIRVILRSFSAVWAMRTILNPFRYGFFSFQLLIHKVLRYLIGLFQIALFVSSCFLAGEALFYLVFLALQGMFYLMSAAGFLLEFRRKKLPIISYAYYFCLLNGAALLALWKFLKGESYITWQPRKGH